MAMDLDPAAAETLDEDEQAEETTKHGSRRLGLTPTRRSFLLGAAAAAVGIPVFRKLWPDPATQPVNFTQDVTGQSPQAALDMLRRGNSRWMRMMDVEPNINLDRRRAVAAGQFPFAGIIGCVDSRVTPELVFDRGIGDLFVARVAGNIADDAVIGSMEYGVEEFDLPLLVVLGHTGCGAVSAAMNAVGAVSAEDQAPDPEEHAEPPSMPPSEEPAALGVGEVGSILESIAPAAQEATTLEEAIRRNVVQTVEALKQSELLALRMEFGVLAVVGAIYDVDTGAVDFTVVPAGFG